MFYAPLVFSLITCTILPILLPLLYGKDFAQAVLMGQILIFVTPFRIADSVLMNYLSAEGKFKYITEAEVVSLLLGMIVMLSLFHIAEGLGAVIGVAVASIASWTYKAIRSMGLGLNVKKLISIDVQYMVSMTGRLIRKPVNLRQNG